MHPLYIYLKIAQDFESELRFSIRLTLILKKIGSIFLVKKCDFSRSSCANPPKPTAVFARPRHHRGIWWIARSPKFLGWLKNNGSLLYIPKNWSGFRIWTPFFDPTHPNIKKNRVYFFSQKMRFSRSSCANPPKPTAVSPAAAGVGTFRNCRMDARKSRKFMSIFIKIKFIDQNSNKLFHKRYYFLCIFWCLFQIFLSGVENSHQLFLFTFPWHLYTLMPNLRK